MEIMEVLQVPVMRKSRPEGRVAEEMVGGKPWTLKDQDVGRLMLQSSVLGFLVYPVLGSTLVISSTLTALNTFCS